MSTPNISIIVPVYNTVKYLDKCLESLARQTITNIEIICIDDCSTEAICREKLSFWAKKPGN